MAAPKRTTADSIKRAQAWFQRAVKTVAGKENTLPSKDRPLVASISRITPKYTGRLLMFYYDPKLKEILPYYDRFPLVIPVNFYDDGFLGLNLHYLPIPMRKQLLDALFTHYKNQHLSEKKRLQLDYELLKGASKYRWFKPCLKRYLYGHVRSKFHVVDPKEWEMVITLPLERFEKASTSKVWADSRRKIGQR